MLLDLINLQKVRRAFVYFGFILAALLVQNSILDKIEILGVKAMFLPAVAAVIGFFEGGVWGVVFGLVLGLFCDIGMGESTVLFTVFMPLIGFAAGVLTTFFLTKRLFAFFIISFTAIIIGAFLQLFGVLVISGADPVRVLLTGGFQVLWSTPMIFPVYYSGKRLSELDLSK